jgi:ABC-2 type transport system ATP-binding protein
MANRADRMLDNDQVTSPAIETRGLRKTYGRTVALDGLDLQVAAGEVFGFLGPNGAGKTTAVKLLLGLTRPSAGQGWVLGQPIGDRETRGRVGYLPELFRYQAWLTAREVLGLHAQLAGVPVADRRAEIARVLELSGLAGRADDRTGGFSKGMQQRLGLAASLLGDPALVILDEPTSALDPVGRVDVRAIIGEARDRGTTVFLNSHLLGEVERLCDRVAIVHRGRVVAAGSLGDLLGESSVRIRVLGLPPGDAAMAPLAALGAVERADDWLTIRHLDPDRVPDVVALVVGLGGRVYSVEAGRRSLEDLFLGLVQGAASAVARDAADGGPAGLPDTSDAADVSARVDR